MQLSVTCMMKNYFSAKLLLKDDPLPTLSCRGGEVQDVSKFFNVLAVFILSIIGQKGL